MKPEVNKSMMLLLEHGNKKSNHLLPLLNFIVKQYDTEYHLIIHGKDLIPKRFQKYKYHRIILSISNDPRIVHAADWSDLGTFRIRFKLEKPVLKISNNKITIIVDTTKNEIEQRFHMADRE